MFACEDDGGADESPVACCASVRFEPGLCKLDMANAPFRPLFFQGRGVHESPCRGRPVPHRRRECMAFEAGEENRAGGGTPGDQWGATASRVWGATASRCAARAACGLSPGPAGQCREDARVTSPRS